MGKRLNLLVDTDIFIDHLNHQVFRAFFEEKRFKIYYSAVTKKELLSKKGLKDSEKKAIIKLLKGFRCIHLNQAIADKYSELISRHRHSEKADCLIAATAIVKNYELATRNYKHFKIFSELKLYFNFPPKK